MRQILLAAEIVGTALMMLALAAPPACGQSLGEVTAATGVHGTLARQGGSSSRGALGSVKQSLAKSTKPKDLGLGSSSGGKSGSRPTVAKKTPSRSSAPRSSGGGSWVTAASTSRGNSSSAWLQGGQGWNSGGGGRAPARRPRS